MIEALDLVKQGEAPRIEQDEPEATYESWCTAKEAGIDWSRPAQEVHNLIRGTDPVPAAWVSVGGQTIQLFGSTRADGAAAGEPGEILGIDDAGMTVAADGGAVRVARLRAKGGKKLAATEAAAGTWIDARQPAWLSPAPRGYDFRQGRETMVDVTTANEECLRRMDAGEPVLVDVLPAIETCEGMEKTMILGSGPQMPFGEYFGGQREGLIGGALFEDLASDRDDAIAKLESGEIQVEGAHAVSALGLARRNLLGLDAGLRGAQRDLRQSGTLQFLRRHQPAPAQLRGLRRGREGAAGVHQRHGRPSGPGSGQARGRHPAQAHYGARAAYGRRVAQPHTAASLLFLRELVPHFMQIAKTQPTRWTGPSRR